MSGGSGAIVEQDREEDRLEGREGSNGRAGWKG